MKVLELVGGGEHLVEERLVGTVLAVRIGVTPGAITDGDISTGATHDGAVTSTGTVSLLVKSSLGERTLTITVPAL